MSRAKSKVKVWGTRPTGVRGGGRRSKKLLKGEVRGQLHPDWAMGPLGHLGGRGVREEEGAQDGEGVGSYDPIDS